MKQLILYFSLFVLSACREHTTADHTTVSLSAAAAIPIDSTGSSCPHFARDVKGNIILSWIRAKNDSNAVVCFAVSSNGGQSFSPAKIIAPSTQVNVHAENMPKVIVKPSGEMIATWGASKPNPGNAYAGLVLYSQSFDSGVTWTPATPLVKDPRSFDQRYFDLALLPDGEAAIIWLDNRKEKGMEGSSIYFAATSGKEGFQHETLIAQSCCECCRTNLFVDSRNNIHVAYRAIVNDSIRDMVHAVSHDNGKSFSTPQRLSNDNWVINGCPHTGPAMVENKVALHFAWYTLGSGSGLYFCRSIDNGHSFSARDSIRNKAAARHPQLGAFPGGEMLVVWDETMQAGNIASTRIGVQKRSVNGERMFTQYITPDTMRATYPVLLTVDDQSALVAYDEYARDKSRVVYRMLNF